MASSAQQINAYLKRYRSPLAGYGNAFVQAGRRYGVSPNLLVAIAGAESSFGKITSGTHNPFGWGPGIDFSDWNTAINTVARGLRQNYLNQGLKSIGAIGSKYAPGGAANDPTNLNSNWSRNVSKFYSELGGGTLAAPSSADSPAPASSQGSTPSQSPPADFSSELLSDLSSGRGYDPLKSLERLTLSVAAGGINPAQPGLTGPAPAPARSGKGITWSGQETTHDTDGLSGYPAVDLFAKPGTAFLAPENGKVVRLSGRGGTSGNVFGYSVYFQGDSGRTYFITHLNSSRPRPGTRVRSGQRLGTVSRWSGGSPHAHVGVHG